MNETTRLYIYPETFANSYYTLRRSMGLPPIEQIQLSEGGPIPLYALLVEVLWREGFHVVTRTRLWPEIAARLGLTPAAHNKPAIMEQLKVIYGGYLLSFEEGLVQNTVRDLVSRWWTQHATNNPSPYRIGAEPRHWVEVLSYTKEEIAERKIPKDLIDVLNYWRPVFRHYLRNLEAARNNAQRQAAQAPNLADVTTQRELDWQKSLWTEHSKRHRLDSPAGSTSTGISYDGRQAEKRPRIDPRTTASDSSQVNVNEYEASFRTTPAESTSTPSEDDAPPQTMQPTQNEAQANTQTDPRIVHKPTVLYRPPTAEELRDAELWMSLYRQEMLKKGFGGVLPQIAPAEWRMWYALFVEVRQLISQLYPCLPIALCKLSEEAACALAGDIVKVEVQQRFVDLGKRQALLLAWQLSLMRENLRGWLREFYGPRR